MMIKIGFGKMMREFREAHNLTQRELAEMMDISTNHVSVLEREEKLPRASTIEAFDALKTRDDLEKYTGVKRLSEEETEEYIRLIQNLNRLDDKKKVEAMKAIIRLLGLM
ncbi:MAG: helix-turn-helix transcriptional regulator [Lachnospiraceae bacterium]|nr:helix-turn-helix transcriptional regulator [Lachnospiraceae bacterium]